ncbi:MAG TPA: hypothetical protein VN682_08660 [Terriglobales bacterium]|jgi:hypothetical protein|nr:hypothetical protein [Terriglobales bacterium]
MQELIAQEPKNWLQLYVDAMTEKDPYKRLALVRRLREVPRHDESDENPERPRLQQVPRPTMLRPAPFERQVASPPRPVAAPPIKLAEPTRSHKIRKSKSKTASKSARRSPRLRSA